MKREDGQVYSSCILQFSCFILSTTVCSQNISKLQNVNIADEIFTDYSFLSRYHYTKSKNYLKRLYWIRHWIPMFIGTPCTCRRMYFCRNYAALKWAAVTIAKFRKELQNVNLYHEGRFILYTFILHVMLSSPLEPEIPP